MTWWAALYLLAILVIVASTCLFFSEPRKASARYQRCLRNIDKLERELFPEWFKVDRVYGRQVPYTPEEIQLKPGAVWALADRDTIQFVAAGLHRSGAHKRAVEQQHFYGQTYPLTACWFPGHPYA